MTAQPHGGPYLRGGIIWGSYFQESFHEVDFRLKPLRSALSRILMSSQLCPSTTCQRRLHA